MPIYLVANIDPQASFSVRAHACARFFGSLVEATTYARQCLATRQGLYRVGGDELAILEVVKRVRASVTINVEDCGPEPLDDKE